MELWRLCTYVCKTVFTSPKTCESWWCVQMWKKPRKSFIHSEYSHVYHQIYHFLYKALVVWVPVCWWSCIYPADGPGTVWATSVPQRQSPDAPQASYKLDVCWDTSLCTFERYNLDKCGSFDVLVDKQCFPLGEHIRKQMYVLLQCVTQQRESPPGKRGWYTLA